MNHALGADIFVVPGIPIGVEYAGEIFEDLFGYLSAARHFEVEHHAFARGAVLPEVGSMVLAFLVRRLHSDKCFVCLDVAAGKQIAFHHLYNRNQQLAHTQHPIVDRGECHIDTQIAPEDRALAIKWDASQYLLTTKSMITSSEKIDLGAMRTGTVAVSTPVRDTRCAGTLLALDDAHKILGRVHVEHFGLSYPMTLVSLPHLPHAHCSAVQAMICSTRSRCAGNSLRPG